MADTPDGEFLAVDVNEKFGRAVRTTGEVQCWGGVAELRTLVAADLEALLGLRPQYHDELVPTSRAKRSSMPWA
jgi:hypothetical protein